MREFSADFEESTRGGQLRSGRSCSPGGDTADYPASAPGWPLGGGGAGAGAGAAAGVCGPQPRLPVLPGGHVQFEREDSET